MLYASSGHVLCTKGAVRSWRRRPPSTISEAFSPTCSHVGWVGSLWAPRQLAHALMASGASQLRQPQPQPFLVKRDSRAPGTGGSGQVLRLPEQPAAGRPGLW